MEIQIGNGDEPILLRAGGSMACVDPGGAISNCMLRGVHILGGAAFRPRSGRGRNSLPRDSASDWAIRHRDNRPVPWGPRFKPPVVVADGSRVEFSGYVSDELTLPVERTITLGPDSLQVRTGLRVTERKVMPKLVPAERLLFCVFDSTVDRVFGVEDRTIRAIGTSALTQINTGEPEWVTNIDGVRGLRLPSDNIVEIKAVINPETEYPMPVQNMLVEYRRSLGLLGLTLALGCPFSDPNGGYSHECILGYGTAINMDTTIRLRNPARSV